MIREHTNITFLSSFKRYEPVNQDSTAMRTFKECPRKYFYRIVLGLVSKNPTGKPYVLDFGSAYHKFREELELYRFDNPTSSTAECFHHALSCDLVTSYAPKIDPSSKQDLELYSPTRLMQCCAIAFKFWENEKKQGKFEVISVEQPFNTVMPDGSLISGRADQIVRWGGKLWNRDFKTTAKDLSMFKRGIDPNDQVTRYTYGLSLLHGEPLGGVILEVLTNHKSKQPEISPVIVPTNKARLLRWEQEQIMINRVLKLYRDEDTWPMSDTGNGCAWCEYRDLCSSGNDAQLSQRAGSMYAVKPWRMENVEQVVVK